MATRREYTQTTQLTRSDVEMLRDYNEHILNEGVLSKDAEALAEKLYDVRAILTTIDMYIDSSLVSTAEKVVAMIEDLNATEIRAIKASLNQGITGMDTVLASFDSNPSWQMVELTYGVLLYVEDGIRIVSSENNAIERVKINGSWVS